MSLSSLVNIPGEGHKEILCAAAACFSKRGYCGTTIEGIADQLGCTIGRIYHFYGTKMDLFLGVHQAGQEICYNAVFPIYNSKAPAIDRLFDMASEHVNVMIQSLKFQKVVRAGVEMHFRGATTPAHRDKLDEIIGKRKKYSRLFRDVMEESRGDGVLAYRDGGVAVQLLFMTLNSPVYWQKSPENYSEEETRDAVRHIVTYALSGLGVGKNSISSLEEKVQKR